MFNLDYRNKGPRLGDVESILYYRNIDVPKIFYNRVPKCGSETIRFILLRLAWYHDFEWITSTQYLDYAINATQQVNLSSL